MLARGRTKSPPSEPKLETSRKLDGLNNGSTDRLRARRRMGSYRMKIYGSRLVVSAQRQDASCKEDDADQKRASEKILSGRRPFARNHSFLRVVKATQPLYILHVVGDVT